MLLADTTTSASTVITKAHDVKYHTLHTKDQLIPQTRECCATDCWGKITLTDYVKGAHGGLSIGASLDLVLLLWREYTVGMSAGTLSQGDGIVRQILLLLHNIGTWFAGVCCTKQLHGFSWLSPHLSRYIPGGESTGCVDRRPPEPRAAPADL